MNISQRIHFISGNTDNINIKVRLEQNINTIEFLSLNITTEEAYQDFNSDYGVLIGRVIANGNVGIPNAKISIFIPLSDVDATDSEMVSLYPYKTPRDLNNEGKRYNLLPRVAKKDPVTQIASPRQPFGSFPIKEEIITNMSLMNMYKKYYKYTAITNDSGDYMIFGVPVGTQTVHMSVDITDIGEYSMSPSSMILDLGYSSNAFINNGTLIKPSSDLNDLPNIETQEISVNVIPFWGDTENFEIGITRQDFRIRTQLKTSFVLFGSAFTDSENASWGKNELHGSIRIGELYRAVDPSEEVWGMYNKRIGIINEKIYYYPNSITDTEIDIGLDDSSRMKLLDKSQYVAHKRNGDFVFIINSNRKKIITNEYGVPNEVTDESPNGIYTEFRGFITLELTYDELPYPPRQDEGIGTDYPTDTYRYKLKFPQHGIKSFKPEGICAEDTQLWKNQNFKFEAGKKYSLAKYHAVTANNSRNENQTQFPLTSDEFFRMTCRNTCIENDRNWDVGVIVTSDVVNGNTYYPNATAQFPNNFRFIDNKGGFGANWMNISVYLPQFGKMCDCNTRLYAGAVQTVDHFSCQTELLLYNNKYFLYDNNQPFVAGECNTKFFPRSDLNWTDIIEVPVQDICTMLNINCKGFIRNSHSNNTLSGCYRNGDYIPAGWGCHSPYGETCSDICPATSYFYKGFGDANVIDYLYCLNLI